MGRDRSLEEFARREVVERFRFHPATAATGPKHDEIREAHRSMALWLMENLPNSRERSLALTALQESMMWSNAAIAIHTKPEPRAMQKDEA